MVIFYRARLDAGRLQRALTRVLDDFSQYAGKLVVQATLLQIQHGARAVSFETVQSDDTVNALTSELEATGRCRKLEPQASMLDILRARERTLLVRLTQLRDGCVLGIGWNHAVGDMHSTMLLMRAWADAYAERTHKKPIILTDREAYFRAVLPNTSHGRSVVRRVDLLSGLSQRLQMFRPAVQVHARFTDAELSDLQRAASTTTRVSRNDALCSHVYAVLRRLSAIQQQTNLCLVVNFRKRLGLPDQVVGNMTSLVAQPVRKHHGAAQIAASLRKKLNAYAEKQVHYHPTARAHHACATTRQRMRLISRQFRLCSGDIFITNWNDFGAYDLAFAEHRPSYFHPIVLGGTQLPQWFMIVYEWPDGAGLAVTLGLPKAEAQRWASAEGQAMLHPDAQRERTLVNGVTHAPQRAVAV